MGQSNNKIRLLIIDDSALVRQVLSAIFAESPDVEVVGVASDPYIAREKIKALNPDVLTLDVEMPRMDGLTFLSNLMRLRPMPVVMISSLTENGADVTLRALEIGAVDFVAKPKIGVADGLQGYTEEILAKVRLAAQAKPQARVTQARKDSATGNTKPRPKLFKTTDRIIGIGASTGGTEAIKQLLAELPPDMPGIVISQHIPVAFSQSFANRVNQECDLTVCQATDRQQIMAGHAYIAPGDQHLKIVRDGGRYLCRLDDGPAVNRHKPSVEVMFNSLADQVGINAVGVMLTGMGADGVEGLARMKQQGSEIYAQDENSSVVWGMPGEVVKRGLADKVMPPVKLAKALVELFKKESV